MSDFFQEPAAMREMDDSADNNLVIEAMAELNAGERPAEEVLRVNRSAGEKFIKIRDRRGHGAIIWIAKRIKKSERQVRRIIALAESSLALSIEEQLEILWGHPAKAAGEKPAKGKSTRDATKFDKKEMWLGYKRFERNVDALARKEGLSMSPTYAAAKAAVRAAQGAVEAFQKEAGIK